MAYLFLDTESLGLSLQFHDIWELAYAIDDSEIFSGFLTHDKTSFESMALEINGYEQRCPTHIDGEFENETRRRLMDFGKSGEKLILVGANPSFDSSRLSRRWGGIEPWHYRMIDVSVYAMPLFDLDEPPGLLWLREALADAGLNIPEPDHTAAGDVATVREVFYTLQSLYGHAGTIRLVR